MNNNKSEQKVVRKKYSPQFKDLALERIAKEGVPQVAKDLGLAESLLYSWKAQRNKGGDSIECVFRLIRTVITVLIRTAISLHSNARVIIKKDDY
uniref:transposase n=1 Tax=Legionella yabuuchiae TaxID=376727 RepID=UPI0013EFACF5